MTTTDENLETQASAEDGGDLGRLYTDFSSAHLVPLWTQREDLMPMRPTRHPTAK